MGVVERVSLVELEEKAEVGEETKKVEEEESEEEDVGAMSPARKNNKQRATQGACGRVRVRLEV